MHQLIIDCTIYTIVSYFQSPSNRTRFWIKLIYTQVDIIIISRIDTVVILVCGTNIHEYKFIFLLSVNWLTISRRYNNRISSSGGIDSTLHVKLYTSSEPLNVGEMNSAGPGRPDISMYFFVRPNALSATQLQLSNIPFRCRRIKRNQQQPSNRYGRKRFTEWGIQFVKKERRRRKKNSGNISIIRTIQFENCYMNMCKRLVKWKCWCWRFSRY